MLYFFFLRPADVLRLFILQAEMFEGMKNSNADHESRKQLQMKMAQKEREQLAQFLAALGAAQAQVEQKEREISDLSAQAANPQRAEDAPPPAPMLKLNINLNNERQAGVDFGAVSNAKKCALITTTQWVQDSSYHRRRFNQAQGVPGSHALRGPPRRSMRQKLHQRIRAICQGLCNEQQVAHGRVWLWFVPR